VRTLDRDAAGPTEIAEGFNEGGTMALMVRRSVPAMPVAGRPDPFGELEELHARTEQLLEGFMRGGAGAPGAAWAPLVDIEETDDAWIVEAEVPGARKKDVHVDLQGNELIITGDIKERERKGIVRRRTRRTGEFEFRVTLPGGVDPNNIQASIDDGVLRVSVPKPEPVRSRQIEITQGSSNGDSPAIEGREAS
jgi:HSP20 family protein